MILRRFRWWEVQWALDANKPVYAFLLDPKAAWTGEREQDRLTSATTERSFVEIGRAVHHHRIVIGHQDITNNFQTTARFKFAQ